MTALIENIMPGVAGMANIHPMLVHFPIALLNGFLLMELLGVLLKKEGLRVAASWMLYLGTLGALAAVVAGLRAAGTVFHVEEVHAIMQSHRNLGITVLVLGGVMSAWRGVVRGRFSRKGQVLHLVVAFMTVVTMAIGADLGGLMVYTHGVGVKAVKAPEGHNHGSAMMEGMISEGMGSNGANGHDDSDGHSPGGQH